MPHDIRVVGGSALETRWAEHLALTIDGDPVAAEVTISHLSRKLVSDLPPVVSDLLELAAVVYTADAALSRGGRVARDAGAEWRREMRFEVPARCPETWERPEVGQALADIRRITARITLAGCSLNRARRCG